MSRYLMVLSLGGCAQLAGIDDTTGPASPDSVTLSIDRFSIGATAVEAPLDLTGLTATYLELDPEDPTGFRRTPAELADPMTWAATIPEGTPSVLFTMPDLPTPTTRLYALGQRTLRVLQIVAEHPAPTPPPDGATIAAAVTLDAAFTGAENFVFYTAGAWSQRPFIAPIVGDATLTQTFPYAEATSLVGRPLEKITAADAVLVLKYVGATLTGVLDLPGFDQTGTDTVAGTIVATAADQTVDVPVVPTAIANRFGAGRPAVAGLAMNWGMTAAPGSKVASTLGPTLTAGTVAAADTQITATFG
ncbi:MAG: hypothetical protein H0T79_07575, partial [Deltaproteobacteria bacterium]|nr:hypothetical protein [Deltaproteobacteria bacterium]